MFAVKIYKPDKKSGGLKLKKKVSAKKCLKDYWDGLQKDPLRGGLVNRSGFKYNKGDPTKCVECSALFQDVRRITCSDGCSQLRLKRQRARVNNKKVVSQKTLICQNIKCNKTFKAARADRIFCSTACRAIIHFSKIIDGKIQQFCTKEFVTGQRRVSRTARLWRKVDCKLCKAIKSRR